MNEIFLLLWLADLVGNIGIVGWVLTIGLTVGLVCSVIALSMCGADEEIPPVFRKYISYVKWWLIPLAIVMVCPSQATIKALTVIRVGEYAIASPLGEKSIKALDAVLDRVISESKKSSK